MPNMELITSVTVGAGGAASVTLPATGIIPQTYTDLKLIVSARNSNTDSNLTFKPNNSTTGISLKLLTGDGSSSSSNSPTTAYGLINPSDMTASTFAASEWYIPNYTSSNYKSWSVDETTENNASTSYTRLQAGLWSNNSAITSIVLTAGSSGTFVEGSTFYLYGISNVQSSPKATGGIVTQDANYWYHTFLFTGTFTPTSNVTCDYLVIAGGGGGSASGAGAGGLRTTVGATTGGGGTIESAIALTSGTAYTITIGAGGAGSSNGQTTAGSNGGNSSIAGSGLTTITSIGGGAGTPGGAYAVNGINGGSGSGGFVGGGGVGQVGYGGSGTANQGYAGGNTSVGESSQSSTGSGGGAGGPGQVGTKLIGAVGGSGMSIPSIANATFTGVNSYYAGGGGSAIYDTGNVPGVGGVGGGGNGASNTVPGSSGVANTGGGAGGYYSSNYYTAAYRGGSGLVVLRYAK